MKEYWLELCLQFRILRNTLRRLWHVAVNGPPVFEGVVAPEARLSAKVIRASGRVEDLGLIGTKVVTTAFVNFVVDQLQVETSVFGDFRFHDSGIGTVAEAVGDTDLGTKVETGRASGSQTEAAANVYRSVGTIAYTATRAITEHGLFNAASAGTLMDRTVFAAINVANGDSIQFTYDLTLPAGS